MVGRGFAHQCTDYAGLDSALLQCSRQQADAGEEGGGQDGTPPPLFSAYIGFDATATSLHVGNLLQLMMLRRLQRCGHRPVLLLGGGTTLIGDPSGRDQSRALLTPDVIRDNAASLSRAFGRFVQLRADDRGGAAAGAGDSNAGVVVNNAEWLGELALLPFLRDVGAHFPMARLLSFESAKRRLALEQPFTFLEFSYILLQAYDFAELSRRHGVRLQLGGSDQWGNIVAGVELARRRDGGSEGCGGAQQLSKQQLFGLTAPLLTTADGMKMGKSVGGSGTVWLDPDRTSPYDYWQFWRNVADADVGRLLKLFTDMPVAEIEEDVLGRRSGGSADAAEGAAAPGPDASAARLNAAKALLADAATAMLHGADAAKAARSAAQAVFGSSTGVAAAAAAAAGGPALPLVALTAAQLAQGGGVPVVDVLVELGLEKSKKAARRLIAAGGARLDGEPIDDEVLRLTAAHFRVAGASASASEAAPQIVLSAGRKRHGIVRLKLPSGADDE
eukprot:g3017.t1